MSVLPFCFLIVKYSPLEEQSRIITAGGGLVEKQELVC